MAGSWAVTQRTGSDDTVSLTGDGVSLAAGSLDVPAASDEPSYTAGVDTLLLDDGFDSYGSAAAIVSAGLWTHAERQTLVTGRGGTGQACRLTWPQHVGQDTAVLILEDVLGAPRRCYIQFWFRILPTGLVYNGDGIKWAEFWRATGARWTCGVGTQSGSDGPPGYGQSNYEFNVHDNHWQANPPDYWPFCQNLDKSIKWSTVNDGNWHRMTYHVHLDTGKGVEEWVDGTKLLSTFDGEPGVPSGGMAEPASNLAIVKFGDVQVDAPTPNVATTIDYDDVLIWVPGA